MNIQVSLFVSVGQQSPPFAVTAYALRWAPSLDHSYMIPCDDNPSIGVSALFCINLQLLQLPM